MTIPHIQTSRGFYVRAKIAAWVQTANPSSVEANAVDAVGRLLTDDIDTAIIDFYGVTYIGQDALRELRRVQHSKSLIFSNCGSDVLAHFRSQLGKPTQSLNYGTVVYGRECPTALVLLQEAIRREKQSITEIIAETFTPWETRRRMTSSPLLATGIFDARKIIGDPTRFALVAARLDQVVSDWMVEIEGNAVRPPAALLAASLRGSTFAAALQVLSSRGWEIDIVDHIGPKYSVFEDANFETVPRNREYLYVADFIVGGSELRGAQVYAQMRGSRITHATALGCWLDPAEYTTTCGIPVRPLIDLRACDTPAEFSFS